jgi:hypothetical protein
MKHMSEDDIDDLASNESVPAPLRQAAQSEKYRREHPETEPAFRFPVIPNWLRATIRFSAFALFILLLGVLVIVGFNESDLTLIVLAVGLLVWWEVRGIRLALSSR